MGGEDMVLFLGIAGLAMVACIGICAVLALKATKDKDEEE